MLMTPCEGEPPYSVDLFLSCFPPGVSGDMGPPSSFAAWRLCCRGCPCRAGDDGCREGSGVTDDSEIVRLSDRVMAGRHSLTDQARREEIRGEEGWGREEKPGSFVFQSGEIWGGGDSGKKTDSEVAAVLLCRVIKEEAPILVDDVFQEGSKTENALH